MNKDEKILNKTSEPNLRAHLKDQILGGSGIYKDKGLAYAHIPMWYNI